MNEQERKEIEEQIQSLPKGSITIKHINGKEYEYWQFRENGKQITRRVKGQELEVLRLQIGERKRLEKLLKEAAVKDAPVITSVSVKTEIYKGLIRIGSDLLRFAEPVRQYKHREIYMHLHDYIYGPGNDRVFILYGLRRTGKTTMIRQTVLDMSPAMQEKAAFIQIYPNESLATLNQDLKLLEKQGFRYVFIDEVTLLADFIEGAALFSDIFAASGMKIVLSGTDSLGFLFAEDEQLYDRCFMLHTTFIPYREFEQVLGIKGIDEYIRYGGTMSLGGLEYNKKQMPFASGQRTNEYINSAIARNIQHSLKNYQHEGHFRELYDLYEKNELTSAINRVIEDMNHRFTLDVMTRAFISHDLGVSKANLRRDREAPTDVLDTIDEEAVTKRLKILLEIREREEQKVPLTEEHIREIREYLEMLDLIYDIDIVISGNKRKRTVFTQPGLRYAQAEALVVSLMQDEMLLELGIKERMRITERILSEIRGRMMEDIVLLETILAEPEKQVFVLQFAVGEFDMVTFDPASISCKLYEIKHSQEIFPGQYRHLTDEKKLRETRKQYGEIAGRFVIYNGEASVRDDIQYLNVEEYLTARIHMS
ncbi:MAG: AAA family ATPase [Eubacterium sp.]|nr:AAA family ATPase [Eubacterium sp.]